MRVTNSNANAAGPLIVAGYNVSGSVRSDGEPMKGVKFILFSSLVNKEVSIQKEGTKIRLGAAGRASAELEHGMEISSPFHRMSWAAMCPQCPGSGPQMRAWFICAMRSPKKTAPSLSIPCRAGATLW